MNKQLFVQTAPPPQRSKKSSKRAARRFFRAPQGGGGKYAAATFGAHLCAVTDLFFPIIEGKTIFVSSTAKRQRGLQRGKPGSPLPCFVSFCRSKRKAPAASGVNYAFAKGSTPPIGDHKLSPAGQAHSLGLCKRPRPAGRRNENMPRQKDRKKLLPQRDRSFICGGKWGASDGSLYFAGTQAAGAGVDTAGSTVYNCLYSSDIGLPGTVRTAMGVRNLDTESDALTTNFAFCHLSAPPYRAI